MTTDITELTQKRNAAISRLSRAFEPGHSSQSELDALSYAVDVMNELVEAQAKNALGAGGIEAAAKLYGRIAELESFHTAYMAWSDKTDWVRTDRRFDVVKPLGKHLADVLKAYIEHLESRTVKLPEKFTTSMYGTSLYEDRDILKMLTDAGIKWEAE